MSQFDTPFAQAIDALGQTPESVTAKMREMGIKGYRRMAGSCPVARYLWACGFPRVTVSSSARRYRDSRDDSEESVSLNVGVKQWICDFDDGKYPEFYLE